MGEESKRQRGRPRAFDRKAALEIALKLFWARGYEPTTVAELCAAMGINPPSLYAAFGNKATLFLEAVRHYEQRLWREPAKRLLAATDVRAGLHGYFQEAATILISPEAPCGCMTVLAGVNIAESETEIITELKKMRQAQTEMFTNCLRKALQIGQIPLDANVPVLALALTAYLEGMSLQAREGIYLADLMAMAALATRLLPPMPEKGKAASRGTLF